MSVELAKPIAAYVAGSNVYDVEARAVCFTADAVVRDEGRDHRGLPAIREWLLEIDSKYRPTLDVLAVTEADGKTVVAARVSGNFPGSPVELRHIFTLGNDKIIRLEIVP